MSRDLCPNDNDELKAALEERPETAASAASAASADADAAAVAAGASTSAEASSNVPASTWNDQVPRRDSVIHLFPLLLHFTTPRK